MPLPGPSEAVRHGGGRRTKNLQGERENKKRREGRKEREKRRKKRERGKERKGEESKRERCTCIRPMGVNHPLRSVKRYKRHEKSGAEKKLKKTIKKKKKKAGREGEDTEKAGDNPFFVSEYRKVCIKSRKLGLKIAKFS